MILLRAILSKASGALVGALAILAGIAALIGHGFRLGRRSERQKQQSKEHEALKIRTEVQQDINSMSDDDVAESLRDYARKRSDK